VPTAASAISNQPGDTFIPVARTEDVPEGSFTEVEIPDEVLILANIEGVFYAVSAWCTHQGTSLALGQLAGSVLTCWAHLWRYDVRTGEPVWPPIARVAPGYRLRTYPVRVVGDTVYVSRRPGRSGLT